MEDCEKQPVSGITIQSIDEFDFEAFWALPVQKRHRGNQGTKKRHRYKDIVTSFDIETTNIDSIRQGVMYVWQWAVGPKTVVMGRTWPEFIEFVDRLCKGLKEAEFVVCYVHNLAFEFQYLAGIYQFLPEDVFSVGDRKVLKATMRKIEFRCSYLHSNMSLKAWCERLGVKHGKLDGKKYNYAKQRFPWTQLSDYELRYCVNDVLGVVEAIEHECEKDDDNLYSIPMTSTGYVRRDTKRALDEVNHLYMLSVQPTWHVYTMLREAFRGGNTHASRFYAGRIIEGVKSKDICSDYPFQLFRMYPVKPFHEFGPATMDEVKHMIYDRRKAVLMRCRFWGIILKDVTWPNPYLPFDKCRNVVNSARDNGRILSADYLEITITDIDFQIILDEYEFRDVEFYDVCHSTYGHLPQHFLAMIMKYYKAKTELKGVDEEVYFYQKSKEKLNSLYGMCAQDPVRISEQFVDGEWKYSDDKAPWELLEESCRKAFLPYQWGVWCTAQARYLLERGMRIVEDGFVYCDTDSIKYVGEADFSELNAELEAYALSMGATAVDRKGKAHPMGVFEDDGEYDRFITYGAKKYAYTVGDELHITIAGVAKAAGAEELRKAGGLDKLRPGFVFREAGGSEVVYNDAVPVTEYDTGEGVVPITRNIYITSSEYTLGLTDEYERLLDNPRALRRIGVDIYHNRMYNGGACKEQAQPEIKEELKNEKNG